jgi:hypothetical protein
MPSRFGFIALVGYLKAWSDRSERGAIEVLDSESFEGDLAAIV